MSFAPALTIPANTGKASPATLSFAILPCRLDEVYLTFPSGCVGLVGVWIEYQSQRLLPIGTDTYFIGEAQTLPIKTAIDLQEPPLAITIKGYNLDDTYPHTVYTLFNVTFANADERGTLAAIQNLIASLAITPQG